MYLKKRIILILNLNIYIYIYIYICYGVLISNYLKNMDQIILFNKKVYIFNKKG